MKIGFDARLFQRAKLGGMGRYLLTLITKIREIGPEHELFLFENSLNIDQKYMVESPKIRKVRFSMRGDILNLWEQLRLPYEIRRSCVDVFHSPANTLPLVQPRPHIITLHDTLLMESDEDETSSFLFYTRKVIPIGLKRAKKIITISENSKKDIIKHFGIPPERIKVIYQGIDPAFRKINDGAELARVRSKYGIKGKYVFIIGSLGPRKNTRRIVRVFHALKREKKIEHQLVICGLNEEAINEFKKIASDAGMSHEIVLTGFVPNEDLIRFYNGAELALYISLYEGFGFPIIESMACGCPIIASNISCMPEIAGEAAVLVDPTTDSQILEEMYRVLTEESLRAEMREKGLKRARMFDWNRTAENTLAVYEEVLQTN
jgi:glycosyltransferase involved in cell wall biosynthesis